LEKGVEDAKEAIIHAKQKEKDALAKSEELEHEMKVGKSLRQSFSMFTYSVFDRIRKTLENQESRIPKQRSQRKRRSWLR